MTDLVRHDVEVFAVGLPRVAAAEAELEESLTRPGVVADRRHARDDLEPRLAAFEHERQAPAEVVLPDLQDAAHRRVDGGGGEWPSSRRDVIELTARIRAGGNFSRLALRGRGMPDVGPVRVAIRHLAKRVDDVHPSVLGPGPDGARS